MSEKNYLIYSKEHKLWYADNCKGYVTASCAAGRYTENEAKEEESLSSGMTDAVEWNSDRHRQIAGRDWADIQSLGVCLKLEAERNALAEGIKILMEANFGLQSRCDALVEKVKRLTDENAARRMACGKAPDLFAHAIGHMGSSDDENKERNFQEAKAILDEFAALSEKKVTP